MDIEHLIDSVAHHGHNYMRAPYLRTYRGKVWTCATNGYALVAVIGRLTENTVGPTVKLSQIVRVDMRRYRTREMSSLKRFLRRKQPVDDNVEVVSVADVPLNRHILRRAVAHVPEGRVKVRAELGGDYGKLWIDGDGFVVLCVGVARSLPTETARFW